MRSISNLLQEKIRILYAVLEKFRYSGKKPDGALKICRKKSGSYFYVRKNGRVKYIRLSNLSAARKLAQQEFEWKSESEIRHYIEVLEEAALIADTWPWDSVISAMPPEKRALTSLPVKSDEEKVADWLAGGYVTLTFRKDERIHHSADGGSYRSKSEAMLADLLHENGIAFIYERELFLQGVGKVYPDFTLFLPGSGREIILEHFGMIDNYEYACRAAKKIQDYAENGYILGDNLFCTFEAMRVPLDRFAANALIQHIKAANG